MLDVPEDVRVDAVESRLFGVADTAAPQFAWNSGIVDGAADKPDSPTINDETLTVVTEGGHKS